MNKDASVSFIIEKQSKTKITWKMIEILHMHTNCSTFSYAQSNKLMNTASNSQRAASSCQVEAVKYLNDLR